MVNVKDTISFARKAYKYHKNTQKDGDLFQRLNKTINQAAPFIEYAADAISSRIGKKKKSTLLFETTTTLITKTFEESSIIIPSNSDNQIFSAKTWSSQKVIFGIIALSLILLFIVFLLFRIFSSKNNAKSRDSGRSIRSTLSSIQD